MICFGKKSGIPNWNVMFAIIIVKCLPNTNWKVKEWFLKRDLTGCGLDEFVRVFI